MGPKYNHKGEDKEGGVTTEAENGSSHQKLEEAWSGFSPELLEGAQLG